MIKQFTQLLSIQFKEFFREPGALFWSFIFPILMSLALGMAFSDKPEIVQNAAVILPQNNENSILKNFLKTNCTKLKNKYQIINNNDNIGKTISNFQVVTKTESELMMKRGQIEIIISEENKKVNYYFDPANASSRLAYILISGTIDNKKLISDNSIIKPLEAKGMRYIDFLVPGLLAMGIMSSSLWGISYSLISKRSKKLLRRIVATPMKKSLFMFTMFLSRFTFSILEVVVLLVFARIVFGITIQGSMFAFAGILISGCFFFMGLAILLASRTSNTQVGNGLVNLFTMPMMLLSGIFFSYNHFPDFAIQIIKYLPLTLFTDSLRSVINEGAGLNEVIVPIVILFTSGLIVFLTGLKIYKWY